MHANSLLLFRKHLLGHFRDGQTILEVGPGGYPSPYILAIGEVARVHYHVTDRKWERIERRMDRARRRGTHAGELSVATIKQPEDYRIDSPDSVYDIVLSGQVLAHVRRPWLLVPEMARVLKPAGLLLTITPVTWRYGPQPIDGWRILPHGMRELHAAAGLETLMAAFEHLDPDPAVKTMQIGGGDVFDTVAVGRKS